MKLEMKDTPGQLVNALKPISDAGGNIIAIVHQREPQTSKETIDVQVVVELAEKRLPDLLELFKRHGIHVQRIGKERLVHRRSLIMIGHIMHTDLSDTVDQIDRTGFAEVSELSMVMPEIQEPSTARITIKSRSESDMASALDILRRVAKRKDLLIVEPLEEMR
ncbi:MAG: amino acid-binding protein [Methanomicrobiales archaeon]|nr:amino acid-binding protein [Methanomicrobiales archaeon]MDI6877347.1 amino acid-binding protein [Methanomicrobiales archaeon]